MKKNIEGIIHRPFAPAIGQYNLKEKSTEEINKYIDKLRTSEKEIKNNNYGDKLAGEITHEISLSNEFLSKFLLNELAGNVHNYVKSCIGKEITKFNIKECWVVCQYQNDYNPIHWHSGHISGAGFLKVPSNLGKNKQDKKQISYKGGALQLMHGSRMFLSHSTYNIVPKVGDFYFFPNYLMHHVYPFKNTKEERRSISFNAKIDDNIYDVYGGD